MRENLETDVITINIKNNLNPTLCENTGKRKYWSLVEIENLKRLYETEGKSLSELKLLFPGRTETSAQPGEAKVLRSHTRRIPPLEPSRQVG